MLALVPVLVQGNGRRGPLHISHLCRIAREDLLLHLFAKGNAVTLAGNVDECLLVLALVGRLDFGNDGRVVRRIGRRADGPGRHDGLPAPLWKVGDALPVGAAFGPCRRAWGADCEAESFLPVASAVKHVGLVITGLRRRQEGSAVCTSTILFTLESVELKGKTATVMGARG